MFIILWQILIYLLLSAESPAFEVQTLDDRTVSGTLAELTADRLILDTAEGRVSVDIEKLLDVSLKQKPAPHAPPASVWIELTDGSTIAAAQYTVQGDEAQITLLNDEVLEYSHPIDPQCAAAGGIPGRGQPMVADSGQKARFRPACGP